MKTQIEKSFEISRNFQEIFDKVVEESFSLESFSVMDFFVVLSDSDVVDLMRFTMSIPIHKDRSGVPVVTKSFYKLGKDDLYSLVIGEQKSNSEEFYYYLLNSSPMRILSSVDMRVKIHGSTISFSFNDDLKTSILTVHEVRKDLDTLFEKLGISDCREVDNCYLDREILRQVAVAVILKNSESYALPLS